MEMDSGECSFRPRPLSSAGCSHRPTLRESSHANELFEGQGSAVWRWPGREDAGTECIDEQVTAVHTWTVQEAGGRREHTLRSSPSRMARELGYLSTLGYLLTLIHHGGLLPTQLHFQLATPHPLPHELKANLLAESRRLAVGHPQVVRE